mgnify:CR=1 FL=1
MWRPGSVLSNPSAFLSEESKFGEQFAQLRIEYAWEEDRTVSPQAFVNAWRSRVIKLPFVEQLQMAVSGGRQQWKSRHFICVARQRHPPLKSAAEEVEA